jgi:glycosyltransferase involved in cell wall biosynthesis
MTSPRVSVIVPVRDRRALLAQALDGLEAQTFVDFEVIVVDDGSTDGSGEEAAGRRAGLGPVRVVPGRAAGAVVARLAGVAAADGEILAFTDSDCVPGPMWLEAGVAAIDGGADVVNGLTMPARRTRPFERSMASGEEGLYPTCNVFYRRTAYEAAGGFDHGAGDRLGFRLDRRAKGDGFGEDTLLAWKVARRGAASFAPDARVEHAVFPVDLRETFSRAVRVAAFPALVREVPELRSTALLEGGWQLGRSSRIPVYATGLALLAGRRRLALAGLAWWASVRAAELRDQPAPRRRLALLPVVMALDAVTAAMLVAGSAKARTVVL